MRFYLHGKIWLKQSLMFKAEENIQLVSFVDGVDTVIVCSFMVQMPQQDPVSFDIVYPLQTLKPISSQLRSRVQNEFAHDDRTWKERLQNAVLSSL